MTKATRSEWARRVKWWRASGLNARDFAMKEGLNASTLRWWASTLRQAAKAPASFIEVGLPSVRESSRIEIVIRDGVRIEVSGAFDAELLRRVVAALEAR